MELPPSRGQKGTQLLSECDWAFGTGGSQCAEPEHLVYSRLYITIAESLGNGGGAQQARGRIRGQGVRWLHARGKRFVMEGIGLYVARVAGYAVPFDRVDANCLRH